MNHDEWVRKRNHAIAILSWASLVCGFIALLLITGTLTKCGGDKVKNIYIDEPTTVPTGSPEPSETPEPTGSPEPTESPEPGCDKVVFDRDLLPLLAGKCLSCHPGFGEYATAVGGIDEWVRRIHLSSQDPRRMPKVPEVELADEQKEIFEGWRADGLIEDERCAPQVSTGSILGIDDIETAIANDLRRINKDDQIHVRYLVAADLYNYGQPIEGAKAAADKLLNSLVEKERNINPSSYVGDEQAIFRIDLRNYELSRQDWLRIETKDLLNLVSRTNEGKSLQKLVATRKPWLHLTNFIEIITTVPGLYYRFAGVPETFGELVAKLDVDYNGDLADGDASLIGNDDSPLTNQKNRLISRHDSQDGFFYTSYDIKPNGDNLFENPLLFGTGSDRIFKFDASEIIYTLPNGLLAYALFNNKGERQDEAPVDIVRDFLSPVPPSPIIQNPVSCFRCHAAGILEARDEVRAHVLQNGSEFGIDDIERVRDLYRPATSNKAIFKVDNAQHEEALKKLGISKDRPDPISSIRDEYRFNWDAKKVASLIFVSEERFLTRLDQSSELREEIGQLLTGSTVTFEQLVAAMPVIIREFRLFEERQNGETL